MNNTNDCQVVSENSSKLVNPIHKTFIAKEHGRTGHLAKSPGQWTIFPEWSWSGDADWLARRQLEGANVIWGLVEENQMQRSIAEFNSGFYKSANKGKNTDAGGNRTVANTHIVASDMVVLDLDNGQVTYKNLPERILDEAWLYHPSASQERPTDDYDCLKMHFLFRMPEPIAAKYVALYRFAYLQQLFGINIPLDHWFNNKNNYLDLPFDTQITDPRREFKGKNPLFTDEAFFGFYPERRISRELHDEIMRKVTLIVDRTEEESELNHTLNIVASVKPNKENSFLGEIDRHLLINCDLATIVKKLFPTHIWQEKFASRRVMSQYESTDVLDNSSRNDSAFSVFHSSETGRIYSNHKGKANRLYNLYELYARYKRCRAGEKAEYADVGQDLRGLSFVELVKEICNKLGVENFKFPERPKPGRPAKEKEAVCTKTQLAEVVWEDDYPPIRFFRNAGKMHYLFYKKETGTWVHAAAIQQTGVVAATLEYIEVLNQKLADKDYPLIDERIKVNEFLELLIGIHDKVHGFIYSYKPTEESGYISFNDGDYNKTTGTFEPYHPSHNIYHRWDINYNFPYDKGIKERYIKALRFMTGSDEGAKILWNYKCAEYLRLGKHVWQALTITGASRTGKSAFCQSSSQLKKYADSKLPTEVIVKKHDINSSFVFSQLSQMTLMVHFPEFNVKTTEDINFMLSTIDSNKMFPINRKNEPIVSMERDFVMGISTQDDIKLPADNEGIHARIVPIHLALKSQAGQPKKCPYPHPTNKLEKWWWHNEINDLFFTPEIQRDLFLYILHNEKAADVIASHKEMMGSNYYVEQKSNVISKNSPLTRAFEEVNFEITGDLKDFVIAKDLKQELKAFLVAEEGYTKVTTSTLEKMLASHIETKYPIYWERIKNGKGISEGEIIDKFVRYGEEKKTTRVVVGVRRIVPTSVPTDNTSNTSQLALVTDF